MSKVYLLRYDKRKLSMSAVKTKLNIYADELKQLKLVAVAYSFIQRDFFPTEDAFIAEKEVRQTSVNQRIFRGIPYCITRLWHPCYARLSIHTFLLARSCTSFSIPLHEW